MSRGIIRRRESKEIDEIQQTAWRAAVFDAVVLVYVADRENARAVALAG
jgi:hypothetical protein